MLVPCPECKKKVSEGAASCPHCGEAFGKGELAEVAGQEKKRQAVGPLGYGIGAILIIAIIWVFVRAESGPTVAPHDTVGVGAQGRLHSDSGGPLLVSTTESVMDELVHCIAVGDKIGEDNLFEAGSILLVPSETPVLVTGRRGVFGTGGTQVRILEGECKGRSGWVFYEDVR
jgi:hypothetical protein